MIRIAFIIISTEEKPWSEIHRNGQVPTWLADLHAEETYLCAYSTGSEGQSWISKTDHRRIEYGRHANKSFSIREAALTNAHHAYFDAVNGYGSLITCTLSAMNYLVQHFQPDYIVRTNVSSYWNLPRLRSFLQTAPRTNFYAGLPRRIYSGIRGRFNRTKYATGAGMIVSVDVATNFVKHHKTFSNTLIDDMAFGLQAKRLKLDLTPLNRLDLETYAAAQACAIAKLTETFHVRCKSYINPGDYLQRDDVKIMHFIHSRIAGSSPNNSAPPPAPHSL
jgi:hypothetical protein